MQPMIEGHRIDHWNFVCQQTIVQLSLLERLVSIQHGTRPESYYQAHHLVVPNLCTVLGKILYEHKRLSTVTLNNVFMLVLQIPIVESSFPLNVKIPSMEKSKQTNNLNGQFCLRDVQRPQIYLARFQKPSWKSFRLTWKHNYYNMQVKL